MNKKIDMRRTLQRAASGWILVSWIHEASPASAVPPGGRSLYVSNSDEMTMPPADSNVVRFTFGDAGLLTLAETVDECAGERASVFTSDLRFAYVACQIGRQVMAYRVADDGALTGIGSFDISAGVYGIAIAPSGSALYVSGGETLTALRIGANGLLTPLNDLNSGAPAPSKGVAVTPSGQFVYVSHGGPMDTQETSLTGFELEADGSIGSQVADVTNGAFAFDVRVTPDGRFLYVVSAGSPDTTGRRNGQVFGYRIGLDGGLIPVPGHSFGAGEFSIGAAISPDGRTLYVAGLGPLGQAPGQITGFAIGDDGALTQIDRILIDGDPIGLEFAPDGRHLYLNEISHGRVIAFDVSPFGGLMGIQNVSSGGKAPTSEALTVLPNLGPIASFSVQSGGAGCATLFDASASSDPDGTVARYDWDFGDGTVLADGGPTPQHAYVDPGVYRARLTVADDEGCSRSLIFMGQSATCVGKDAAAITRAVVVY